MIELNWSLVTLLVVGVFAVSGFYKGWWKEAITNFFLAILVFLLMFPDIAQWMIDLFNTVLSTLWGWTPEVIQNFLGVTATPQFDAASSTTWLIILLLFLGLAILVSRLGLSNIIIGIRPQVVYTPKSMGSFLGGLLGGLNGFLIINLVREYVAGSNLPQGDVPSTEVAMVTGEAVRMASSGVAVRLTDLPRFTTLDNVLAWIIVGIGVLLALLAVRKRAWGYTSYKVNKQ